MRRNELDINSQLVRNILSNPALTRFQSGSDVVLTNWAANPSFNNLTTSYHGGIGGNQASWATIGVVTDFGHTGTRSYRQGNCTVAGQANLKAMTPSATALKVARGASVSWSFWVYSTVAGYISPYWEGTKVDDGTYTGGSGGNNVTVPANTWTYVTGKNTPSFDSYVQGAGGYGLNVPLGASVWFDDFCITTSAEPVPYFDGTTVSDEGYTYAWTGAANASTSVRMAKTTIRRTNLLTNPSFELASGTNNVYTNHFTNPALETSTGTTHVRTNYHTNPSFETANGTFNSRVNMATNPSFETTTASVPVHTNLITHPSFEMGGGSQTNHRINLFNGTASRLAAESTLTTGVSYRGDTWTRYAVTTSGQTYRAYANLADLVNGQAYTIEWEVANDGASAVSIGIDWCDSGAVTYTIEPLQRRKIRTSATLTTYDNTYRFGDLQINTANASILFREIIIEKDTIKGPYFDGATTASTLNYAKGKTVTASHAYGSDLQRLTDGGTDTDVYTQIADGLTGWMQVDLGSVTMIDTIKVWHYYYDGRTYYGTKTEVSTDGVNWSTVSGTGTYQETSAGKTHSFSARGVRYIRDWLAGSTSNTGNHWVEIQAFNLSNTDFTYGWFGSANTSTSYVKINGITGWAQLGTIYRSSIDPMAGSYCLAAVTNGANGDGFWPAADISISASQKYTYSFWVKTTSVHALSLAFRWKNTSGGTFTDTIVPVTSQITLGRWSRVSATATSPAGSTLLQMMARIYETHTPTTMYVDRAMLTMTPNVLDYFDGANPLKNFVPNPDFATDTSGWSFGNGPTRDSGNNVLGKTALKLVRTSASVPVASMTARMAVTGGEVISLSALGSITSGASVAIDVQYLNAGQGFHSEGPRKYLQTAGLGNSSKHDTTALVPTRWSITTTVPEGAKFAYIRFFMDGNGDGTAFVTDAILERTATPSTSFYKDLGDFTYAWSGTADASTSVKSGMGVTSAPSTTISAVIQSSEWSQGGVGKSIRIIALTDWPDTYSAVGGDLGGFRMGMVAGKTYTVSAYTRAQQGVNHNIRVYYMVNGSYLSAVSAQPTGGSNRHTLTFTIPSNATEAFIRLYNGAAGGSPDVWWDDFLLEETTATLPYFDGSRPLTNLISNNSFESAVSDWWPNTGQPTLSTSYEQAFFEKKSMKAVSTLASSDIAVTIGIPLKPKTTYTFSWYVYSPDARTAGYLDVAATNYNFSNNGSVKAIPANTWTRLSATFTTSETTVGNAAFYLHHGGGPSTIGSTIYIDAVLLEESNTLNPYYSGTGDYTYAWSGTANASTSLQKATASGGIAGAYYNSAMLTSGWATTPGKKSLRMLPTIAGNNETFAMAVGTWESVSPLIAGRKYTVSATIRLDQPLTGTLHGNSRQIVWRGAGGRIASTAAPNVAGAHRVKLVFTVPADATWGFIELWNGASLGGGSVWWDDFVIEDGDATGDYFDGSTVQSNLCPNPSFETNLDSWANVGAATLERDTSKAYIGAASMKVTPTGAYTGVAYALTTVEGEFYTVSAWIWAPTGSTVNFAVDNVSGTQGSVVGNGAWQRVVRSGRAFGTSTPVYIRSSGASQPAFWVDAVLIEKSTALNPFFEGTGDFTFAWNGTANASSSFQIAPSFAETNAPLPSRVYQTKLGITGKSAVLVKNGVYCYLDATITGLKAGTKYTVASDVLTSQSSVNIVDRGPTNAAYIPYSKTVTPNVVTRISTTFTTGAAETTRVLSLAGWESAGVADGATLMLDNVSVVEMPIVVPHFDGNTPANGDYTYAWAGTAHASKSYQRAPMVWATAEVDSLAKAYQSKTSGITGAGSKAVRITPTSTANGDSFVELNAMIPAVLTPNTRYTISGDRTILAAQTNINGTTHFRANIGGTEQTFTIVQAPVTNAANTTRVVGRFTTPASGVITFFRAYNGSYSGGGDVWWDNMILEQGWTDGSYFDGSTAYKDGITSEWEGTPNASRSVQKFPSISDWHVEPALSVHKLDDGSGVRVIDPMGTTQSFVPTLTGMVAGRKYTILVRARTYKGASFRIYGTVETPLVTLTGAYAWHRVVVTATGDTLYFATANVALGAGFDISHLMVTEGTYLGNYVDGTTPFAKWYGQSHASNSVGYPPPTPIA